MSIRQARKSDGNRDRYGHRQLIERTLRIAMEGERKRIEHDVVKAIKKVADLGAIISKNIAKRRDNE